MERFLHHTNPERSPSHELELKESRGKIEYRTAEITNLGRSVLLEIGEWKQEMPGSMEVVTDGKNSYNILVSPTRVDLSAAYIPGANMIRVGSAGIREAERDPAAMGRIFAHEMNHLRFFNKNEAEQRALTDLLFLDKGLARELVESFYTALDHDYAGSHDADIEPKLILTAKKTGLKDWRTVQVHNKNVHAAMAATEIFAYSSPLLFKDGARQLEEERRSVTRKTGSFFDTLPNLHKLIQEKATSQQRHLWSSLFIDVKPDSVERFKQKVAGSYRRIQSAQR